MEPTAVARRRSMGAIVALACVISFVTAGDAHAAGDYCVREALPEDGGTRTIDTRCFETQADADQYALGGGTRTIISKHFYGENYSGRMLEYVVNNSHGCNGGRSYKDPSLPADWDDVISSTKNFAGCDIVNHFEFANFGGVKKDCSPCATLGVMNNATSSLKWKP